MAVYGFQTQRRWTPFQSWGEAGVLGRLFLAGGDSRGGRGRPWKSWGEAAGARVMLPAALGGGQPPRRRVEPRRPRPGKAEGQGAAPLPRL